ncbi:MAG: VWA domain-containing protein [Acidimicrobiales bacterium]
MSFANPWGLLALAAMAPIVALHILRPRRRAVPVASTFLWRRIERPVSSASPWQKLRPTWLLAAQLLAVALLALSLAQPQRVRPAPLAQHTVFVIDASGSMLAKDGTPDRLAAAKARAVQLRGDLPAGGKASVVVAGDRARVLLSSSTDTDAFNGAVNAIRAGTGAPAISDAFTLAASLDAGEVPTGIVVLSDGGFTAEERALVPPGSRYERIGERATNRAITRLLVEARGSGLHVRVEIRNTGGPRARQPVRIDVDAVTEASGEVTIEPGALTTFEADVPAGQRIEAFLDGADLLDADNRAVTVVPQRRDLTVFLAGEDRFIGQLLAVLPGTQLVRAEEGAQPSDADVAIYNGVAVPADVRVPLLAIAPPGGLAVAPDTDPDAAPGRDGPPNSAGAVTIDGSVERPSLTTVRTDHPLLEGLDLSEVAIAATQRLNAAAAEVLVGSVETPLLVSGTRGGVPYLYQGFSLADSNLALQVAFPVLFDRSLTFLAGAAHGTQTFTVGDALPVDPVATTRLIGPDGTARQHPVGEPAPTADQPGFWSLEVPGQDDRLVAVNVPPRESQLEPLLDLPIAPDVTTNRTANGSTATSWLAPFVAALLVAMVLETLLARRSQAVGRRQWRSALGLRVVCAVLALVALLAPTLDREADGMATVFVLDDSDSLGAGGRSAGADWVRQALAAKPADARAAVVVFGGDARLDSPIATDVGFANPEVTVDGSATNLATALRLGLAVAPVDARRRLVLLTDGQATRGDTDAALADAAQATIPVDTVTIGGVHGPDVAVTGVKAPPLARVGDAISLKATVAANTAATVAVTLERDGRPVSSETLDLQPGTTTVTLADPSPPSTGLGRYRVSVSSALDTVADNDAVSVGVPIDGPARVLMVEGLDGEAAQLSRALEAGGIGTTVVGADALPPLDVLSTYTSIVLVDVDARVLPAESVTSLERAVRDLGRGLVTVGGPRSFGVGGYRNTPLEELLPVVSDVTDPLRRQKVAQVLSIDTSGSMAACHCRNDANGLPGGDNRLGGGVNKTDIARAAAVRTASSLSAEDEIGVVAFNENAKVVMPLQINPGVDVVDREVGQLTPGGGTFIGSSLEEAAKQLRKSDAALKHIIVFSDGFTGQDNLSNVATQAKQLYEEEGITVSVLATGEGAAPALEQIAVAGNGRFYFGGDLSRIPQIMAEEAVIASRDFVTEGRFLPEVVSSSQVVASLTSSPELLGYVATSSKSTASTLLRIGAERDPLLATWQAGLGRSTAWTSDATDRWSSHWVSWEGFVGFWTQVVKDTFPVSSGEGATLAEAQDGKLKVSLVAAGTFPDRARATARVVGPDGRTQELELSRTNANTFDGEVSVDAQGVYAVGAAATDERGDTVLTSTALATQAYPPEYRPAPADAATLTRIAAATDGRLDPAYAAVWDEEGLAAGRRSVGLRGPLLLAALLLWLVAVALSRIVPRRAALVGVARSAARRVPRAPSLADVTAPPARPSGEPGRSTGASGPPVSAGPAGPSGPVGEGPTDDQAGAADPPAELSTLEQLLRRKRGVP